MNDADLARNYILDRLPEEERDACERRFLFDPEFESVMLEEERALLDDYAHGRLSSDDAAALLRRASEESRQLFRLRFAEGLRRATTSEGSAPLPRPSAYDRLRSLFARRQLLWLGGIACAAAIAIVIAIAGSQLRQTPRSSQQAVIPVPSSAPSAATPAPAQQAAKAAPPTTSSAPASAARSAAVRSVAAFVLLADQSRGDRQETAITLHTGATELRLQLTTQEGLETGRYNATLSDAHGTQEFSATGLHTLTEAGRGYVELRVPATRLSSGEYKVSLTGEPATDAGVPLGFSFTLSILSGGANPPSNH